MNEKEYLEEMVNDGSLANKLTFLCSDCGQPHEFKELKIEFFDIANDFDNYKDFMCKACEGKRFFITILL